MKKALSLILFALLGLAAAAQEQKKDEGYKFTDGPQVKCTSVKNQFRSGTCWCFSTMSFIENEILKASDKEMDLAEMWVVRHAYFDKAVKYVRLHGYLNMAQGGAAEDVTYIIKKYGIVPEEVYPGLNYGTDKPVLGELMEVLMGYVKAVVANKNKMLTTAWMDGLNGILDAYFGKRPEKFTFEGKEYTPASFAESLPVKMDDFVSFTSYTHHPFYEKFAIEVEDNWLWAQLYNLPLNEMMDVVDYALKHGHSIAWGTDVSDNGFSRQKAIGIVPDVEIESIAGTDAERWSKLSKAERAAELYSFKKPVPEKTIDQQMRQKAFDNYDSTDDHGMVIVGTAKDQDGHPFYRVKNSWGVRAPYEGYYYFSRPFVELKTTSMMVNKNAMPKDIRKKLGL